LSSTSVTTPSLMPSRSGTARSRPPGSSTQTWPARPRTTSARDPALGNGGGATSAAAPAGRKRRAALGTLSALSFRSVTMRTLAVMPGSSVSSGFGAETTTS